MQVFLKLRYHLSKIIATVIHRTDISGLTLSALLDLIRPHIIRAPAFLVERETQIIALIYTSISSLPSRGTIDKSSHATIITHAMYDNRSIQNRLCGIVQLNNSIVHIQICSTIGIRGYISKVTDMSSSETSSTWTMSGI